MGQDLFEILYFKWNVLVKQLHVMGYSLWIYSLFILVKYITTKR